MQVARSKRKFNPSCLLHNRGASELTSLVILLRYTGLHEHWITQCHRTFDIIHLQRGNKYYGSMGDGTGHFIRHVDCRSDHAGQKLTMLIPFVRLVIAKYLPLESTAVRCYCYMLKLPFVSIFLIRSFTCSCAWMFD